MKITESLFLGIIAAVAALFCETAISLFEIGNPTGNYFSFSQNGLASLGSIILIPVAIEEFFKFVFIRRRLEEFSLGKILITNSMALGLGFGLVEIAIIFLWNEGYSAPIKILAEIVILHTLTAGLIGLVLAKSNPKRLLTGLKAIGVASVVHLAYNVLVFYRNPAIELAIIGLFSAIFIAIAANSFFLEKKLAS